MNACKIFVEHFTEKNEGFDFGKTGLGLDMFPEPDGRLVQRWVWTHEKGEHAFCEKCELPVSTRINSCECHCHENFAKFMNKKGFPGIRMKLNK